MFNGTVIAPGDEEYDDARRLYNGGFDRHPSAIIRPADVAEVAHVVGLARDSGTQLSVRSGGHSVPGHSVIDDGIVLDLAAMRNLEIDADAHKAWAQTGLTAGEYTTAAAKYGLATGFGDTGSVGIGGITLGGGVGFLSRKQGLTIDNVVAAEIVTADGQMLTADAENHPDLFWAIRGGGGNFGVVARFQYRLHEVRSVVGGMLILPATAENIAAFVAAAEAAPEELSTIANVMTAPPLPFVPAELHGQIVIMGLMCFAGPADAGERALAPFRAIATPIADMVKPVGYEGMFPPEVGDYHPTVVADTMFVDRVDVETAETIMQYLTNSDAPMRLSQIRVLGGAISRVSNAATAYAHRDAKIMVNVVSFYTDPGDKPVRQQWIDGFAAALNQGVDGAFVNFAADGPGRVGNLYPEATLERLSAIKAQYDPTNLFSSNHNIPPGA